MGGNKHLEYLAFSPRMQDSRNIKRYHAYNINPVFNNPEELFNTPATVVCSEIAAQHGAS